MTLLSSIGRKLFYLGYRMQPLRIRRGLGVLMAISLEWERQNEGLLERAMDGETLDLEINFKTVAYTKETTP